MFEAYFHPKNSPLGPQKVKNDPKNSPLGQNVKNDPKIRSNSNVRIEGIIENKSCSTTWLVPKKVLETYPDHNTAN